MVDDKQQMQTFVQWHAYIKFIKTRIFLEKYYHIIILEQL